MRLEQRMRPVVCGLQLVGATPGVGHGSYGFWEIKQTIIGTRQSIRRCLELAKKAARLVIVASCFSACTVAASLTEEKGVDASAVQPGASRAQAEAVLGNAVKEWMSASGVRYGIYHYDAGRRADWDRAYGRAIINLATLGFADLFELIPNHPQFKFYEANRKRRTVVPIVVSFDEKEMILGIFDEFEELPSDGRSTPRNWEKY